MIIYISGPMSGHDDNNFPAFHAAATKLREMGYEVISPAEIEQPDKSWEACMRKDIPELLKADAVVVLPGWRASRGAQLEVTIAKALNMDIISLSKVKPLKGKEIPHSAEGMDWSKYPIMLTPPHVKEILNIGRRQTYELINLDSPPFEVIRQGPRTIRIPKSSLRKYVEGEY